MNDLIKAHTVDYLIASNNRIIRYDILTEEVHVNSDYALDLIIDNASQTAIAFSHDSDFMQALPLYEFTTFIEIVLWAANLTNLGL